MRFMNTCMEFINTSEICKYKSGMYNYMHVHTTNLSQAGNSVPNSLMRSLILNRLLLSTVQKQYTCLNHWIDIQARN